MADTKALDQTGRIGREVQRWEDGVIERSDTDLSSVRIVSIVLRLEATRFVGQATIFLSRKGSDRGW